jgi:hypothetical protein
VHTFARIGTQSACSSVTLNQMPRKLFTVHCFSDAEKIEYMPISVSILGGQKCVFIEILYSSNNFYAYENNIYTLEEMQHTSYIIMYIIISQYMTVYGTI